MKRIIFILISLLWLVSIAFFFGTISLVGWYADAIFLALTSIGLLAIIQELDLNGLRPLLTVISGLLLVLTVLSSISAAPVKPVPEDPESQEYGYFLSRGNLGATGGCYGDVHYFKQISLLPILERRTSIIDCSRLPYMCYVKQC